MKKVLFSLAILFTITLSAQTTYIGLGASWDYYNDGNEPGDISGNNWKDITYAHSWNSGAAPLGYGTVTGVPIVTEIDPSINEYTTQYFRKEFTLTTVPTSGNLEVTVLFEDGGIVYLNGSEIGRFNMPAGSPSYNTTTSNKTPEGDYYTFSVDVSSLPSALVSGTNVITAENHQGSTTSSDCGFDLSLKHTTPPGALTEITTGSQWYYFDSGSEPAAQSGTNWYESTYDYSNWSFGPSILGYGTIDGQNLSSTLSSASTMYFRTKFTVTNPSASSTYRLDVLFEDGGVLYLNGNEIARYNMPAGTISHSTFSASTKGTEGAYETYYISGSNFVNGVNELAASNHQTNATSTDGAFDLIITKDDNIYLANANDTWDYYDSGNEPSVDGSSNNWTEEGYSPASAWSSGQGALGYGTQQTCSDCGAFTQNTTVSSSANAVYFRKEFTLSAQDLLDIGTKKINLRMIKDDGAIVYVNGTEVWRDNMPSGAVSYSTKAELELYQSENGNWFPYYFDPSLLQAGNNVIAVEVHQADDYTGGPSTNAADNLFFDLTAYVDPVNPEAILDVWNAKKPATADNQSKVTSTSSSTDLDISDFLSSYEKAGFTTIKVDNKPLPTNSADFSGYDLVNVMNHKWTNYTTAQLDALGDYYDNGGIVTFYCEACFLDGTAEESRGPEYFLQAATGFNTQGQGIGSGTNDLIYHPEQGGGPGGLATLTDQNFNTYEVYTSIPSENVVYGDCIESAWNLFPATPTSSTGALLFSGEHAPYGNDQNDLESGNDAVAAMHYTLLYGSGQDIIDMNAWRSGTKMTNSDPLNPTPSNATFRDDCPAPVFIDTDFTPPSDYEDWDDDNDGIPDWEEATTNVALSLDAYENTDVTATPTHYIEGVKVGVSLTNNGVTGETFEFNQDHGNGVGIYFSGTTDASGNKGTVELDFGTPVQNLSFDINDIDAQTVGGKNDQVEIKVYSYLDNTTPVSLTPSEYTITGDIAVSGNVFTSNSTAGGTISLNLDFPVHRVEFVVTNNYAVATGGSMSITQIQFDGQTDSDGDGIYDQVDLDSDNDGIPDVVEAGGTDSNLDGKWDNGSPFVDIDLDGIHDAIDNADNGNATQVTSGTPVDLSNDDPDGDNINNLRDIDSDGDGIVDNIEGQTTTGYIAPDAQDSDFDGWDDAYDNSSSGYGTASSGTPFTPTNTDPTSDSTPDYLDLDSDGDGESDLIEAYDTDDNGVTNTSPASSDSDGDGLDDNFDTALLSTSPDENPTNSGQTANSFPDTDSPGGEPNWRDISDADRDGINDIDDLDDDNDGVTDINEYGGNDPLADGDSDNVPAYLDDNDGDGAVGNANGLVEAAYDADGDNIANHLDLDSDNDGITDIVENGGTDANGDGQVDYPTVGDASTMTDADGDGLEDSVDNVDGGAGASEVTSGTPLSTPNTDGDSYADFIDIDSDGDGIVDLIESQTSAGMIPPSGDDSDLDGLDDAYDNHFSGYGTASSGTPIVPINTDSGNDALPDYKDTDTDNDGQNDDIEAYDTDKDETANTTPAGTDSDGDGLDDNYDNLVQESNPGTNALNNQTAYSFPDNDIQGGEHDWRAIDDLDSDGDGVPDRDDLDDDNDGIPDTEENTNGVLVNNSFDAGSESGQAITLSNNDVFTNGVKTTLTTAGNPGSVISHSYNAGGTGFVYYTSGNNGDNGKAIMSFEGVEAAEDLAFEINNLLYNNTGVSDYQGAVKVVVYENGSSTPTELSAANFANLGCGNLTHEVNGSTFSTAACAGSGSVGFDVSLTGMNVTKVELILSDLLLGNQNNLISVDNITFNTGGASDLDLDTDMDGVPDRLDLDSDNDGIVDVLEAGGSDNNFDGRLDDFSDSDGDGLHNDVDNVDGGNQSGTGEVTTGTPLPYPDSDSDGNVNFKDIDSDDDGIVDNTEAMATLYHIDPSGIDADGDGLDDAYDNVWSTSGSGTITGTPLDPHHTDGNSIPDYLDTDTDGDGESDEHEAFDTDGNGIIEGAELVASGIDADNDGLDDNYDLFIIGSTGGSGTNAANGTQNPLSHPDTDIAGFEPNWREDGYPVNIKPRFYLEGPYTSSAMSTLLNDDTQTGTNVLKAHALAQPYNIAPWNYSGTETVTGAFFDNHPEIVDWVLIELRDKNDDQSVLFRRACFLTSDGTVMDHLAEREGTYVPVTNDRDDYFVVIHHRNHGSIYSLSVMSIEKLENTPVIWDTRTSDASIAGIQNIKSMGNGTFALYAADNEKVSGGNDMNANDEAYWLGENGKVPVYNKADHDLNQDVNANDEALWLANNGIVLYVPQ